MNFTKTTNPIYTEFFSKSNLEADVEKTIWRGQRQPSDNSFCFINPKVKYKEREGVVLNKLKEVFGITSDTFNTKFRQAISGDGQEVKRISTLHSSSLAALLMLYSVSQDKPLRCKIKGENYEFVNCYFEVKTKVINNPSNMDVVLVGKNSKDEDVIFFLESKFSEYLNTGMCNGISLEYREIYEKLGLMEADAIKGLSFGEGKKDDVECLQIRSSNGIPQYCSGIKQMISHYIGVTNFIDKGEEVLEPKQKSHLNEIVKLRENGAVIILGEVLFAFGDKVDTKSTKLHRYSTIYNELAMRLNNHTSKLIILPEILTYQELLKEFELDEKVKYFYQLRNDSSDKLK